MDYSKDIRQYLEVECKVLRTMDENEISDVMNILEGARLQGRKVFICGNGGSAATASHFTCDFNKGISYNQNVKYNFECLNDNVPMMMAIANDISYDDIFSEPLKNKMHKDDVLFVISGSGNSRNVINAVKYAKSIGAKTIGLVGYDGGKVKELCDYCIHVKIDNILAALFGEHSKNIEVNKYNKYKKDYFDELKNIRFYQYAQDKASS